MRQQGAFFVSLFHFIFFLALCLSPVVAEESADPDRIAIAVEALSRLKGVDLSTNAPLKAAVMKVLAATRGTPHFVELVKQFQLKDQNRALLEIVLTNPIEPAAVEAMRYILATGDAGLLAQSLSDTNETVVRKTVEALGLSGQGQAVAFLEPLLFSNRSPDLSRLVVRSLAQSLEGAKHLVALARDNRLPENLKGVAASELHNPRWPDIQKLAAEWLPAPQTKNAEPLPPVKELLQRSGDPSRGALVYSRADVGCINCHQVAQAGIDFGPNLSEIGSKLAKEAIYEAILDPNAGISFGYETYQLALQSGDEAYGLIVSDTAQEIAVKDPRGIVTRYPRNEIKEKKQLPISSMPTGLQQSMSVQDLVDLVEYLASLKTATTSK